MARRKGFSCDSIVDDVIADFAPNENEKQRHRKGQTKLTFGTSDIAPINNFKVKKPSFRNPDLMGHTLLPDAVTNREVESAKVLESDGCGLDSEVICEAKRDRAYDEDLDNAKIVKCDKVHNGIVSSKIKTSQAMVNKMGASTEIMQTSLSAFMIFLMQTKESW